MKAYLRVDPLICVRKAHYTDGQFRAYLTTLTLAAMQRERGVFVNQAQLKELLGRLGRHVGALLAFGDLTERLDGTIYVDGWREWQEGDLTVGDRMAALRNRRRNGSVTGAVTGDAA